MQCTCDLSKVYDVYLLGHGWKLSWGVYGQFSVFGSSFDTCLQNLSPILQRCKEIKLIFNWEKSHFMVQEGIVLGHIVSKRQIKVDRVKVELIANLPPPTFVKQIRSFLGHASLYCRFIKNFNQISRLLCNLLAKETPFNLIKYVSRHLRSFTLFYSLPPSWRPKLFSPIWNHVWRIRLCYGCCLGTAWKQDSSCYLLCQQNSLGCSIELHYNWERIASCCVCLGKIPIICLAPSIMLILSLSLFVSLSNYQKPKVPQPTIGKKMYILFKQNWNLYLSLFSPHLCIIKFESWNLLFYGFRNIWVFKINKKKISILTVN